MVDSIEFCMRIGSLVQDIRTSLLFESMSGKAESIRLTNNITFEAKKSKL